MDSQAKRSPLLSPRPDFLGAGWGRERANTFFELLSLSFIPAFISHISLNHTQYEDYGQQLFSKETDPLKDSFYSTEETSAADRTSPANNMAKKFKRHQCCKSITNDYDNGRTCICDDYAAKKSVNPQSEKKDCLRKEIIFCSNNYPSDPENYSYKRETLDVFRILQELKIPFETEIYRPKEERLDVDKNRFYCKNLFLKDRKGQFYLIIFHEDIDMNLKQLRKTLNAHRNFNFATANEMMDLLQTEPGGVTPLALKNAKARDVAMVISNSLVHDGAEVMFHPMDSKLATKISLQSLLRYLKHFGHVVKFID